MEADFFHNPLRLQLALLELKGTQEDQKHVYTSKLSPNQKIRIMTILNQFRDKAARSFFDTAFDAKSIIVDNYRLKARAVWFVHQTSTPPGFVMQIGIHNVTHASKT